MDDASSWREVYKKVLYESHNGNLIKAVHAAETAIFLRSQELDGQGDEIEREEIKAASADLLAVKVVKLGWPAPKIKTRRYTPRKTSTHPSAMI
jgi:hypothetical protein